jgi:hypothetical protein
MIKRVLALLLIVSASLFAAVTVSVDKTTYAPAENIKVTLSGMPGNEGDWVGIFPKNSSNEWENVLTWKFDGNVTDGTHTLDGVPAGEYEARVFLNNSYTLLAKTSFKVEDVSYNTTITTSQATYESNKPIRVTVANMPGNEGDWIGIFPKDAESVWENVLTWKFDGQVVDGTYDLDGVPAGEYEARVFLNNSYTLLAKAEFQVEDTVYDTKVTTSKSEFYTGEDINITLTGMPGNEGDWVGIFEKDAANVWENTLAWKFDGHVVDENYALDSVPTGEYEVRVFLNNSFTLLAKTPFTVVEKPIITTIQTNKTQYEDGEDIIVSVTNMLGNQRDWIGIFEAGSESSFENAYDWVWTDAVTDGEFTFYGLPEGNYEVRAFFSDGFEAKATYSFTVTKTDRPSTIFEDAEGDISDEWIKVLGNYDPRHATPGYNSSGILVLIPQWINNNTENASEFHLPLNHSTQTILEMDMGGLPNYKIPTVSRKGYMPHYSVGVYVKTKKGRRVIIWDSWFNHINAGPHIADYGNGNIWLNNPSPVEHVRGWYKPTDYWCHFRVDIEATLLNLEPDNKLIYVEKLYATGGFLDNIKLSSK